MTDAEILARAVEVQSHWNGTGTPVLIGNRENAVFRVQTLKGSIALRLHRNGYQTYDHIMGEMIWTEALATAGFPCPTPVRTFNDALIVSLDDGQMATAVSWIEAAPIGQFQGSSDAHEKLYFDLGRLLATLHKTTDQMALDINRPSWDCDALLGDDPSWGRFWENPSLSEGEVTTVLIARADAVQHLRQLDNPDTGLIHADAIQENVLSDGQLHLIDFDDSGVGYRLYDLGVSLIQHETSPMLPRLKEAICDGYGISTEHVDLFMMLRGMASAGWVISRVEQDAPALRTYADRMMRCIARYRT